MLEWVIIVSRLESSLVSKDTDEDDENDEDEDKKLFCDKSCLV